MTKRLYQDDSYATTFRSRVISVGRSGDTYAIRLEATLFYPESGSQPCDTGSIGGVRIEEVVEEEDVILHLSSEQPGFGPGDTVEGTIEWPRRFTNMQQHTGQHILSAAFVEELGARTVSSKLGMEICTIDVARLGLGWDDMARAERRANGIVFGNRPVRMYRARAGEIDGLRYKLELADQILARDTLRIIEIEGFDKSPCGATHCRMTGEVGLVKILRWEKIREATRVEFVCGRLAEADYFWKSRFIVDLARQLTTKDVNVPGQVGELLEAHKELRLRLGDLTKQVLKYEVACLVEGARTLGDVRIISAYLRGRTDGEIRQMAGYLAAETGTAALLACGTAGVHFVFARSADVAVDMRKAVEAACAVVDGRGGGKPDFCEGGGKLAERADEALAEAERVLGGMLAG